MRVVERTTKNETTSQYRSRYQNDKYLITPSECEIRLPNTIKNPSMLILNFLYDGADEDPRRRLNPLDEDKKAKTYALCSTVVIALLVTWFISHMVGKAQLKYEITDYDMFKHEENSPEALYSYAKKAFLMAHYTITSADYTEMKSLIEWNEENSNKKTNLPLEVMCQTMLDQILTGMKVSDSVIIDQKQYLVDCNSHSYSVVNETFYEMKNWDCEYRYSKFIQKYPGICSSVISLQRFSKFFSKENALYVSLPYIYENTSIVQDKALAAVKINNLDKGINGIIDLTLSRYWFPILAWTEISAMNWHMLQSLMLMCNVGLKSAKRLILEGHNSVYADMLMAGPTWYFISFFIFGIDYIILIIVAYVLMEYNMPFFLSYPRDILVRNVHFFQTEAMLTREFYTNNIKTVQNAGSFTTQRVTLVMTILYTLMYIKSVIGKLFLLLLMSNFVVCFLCNVLNMDSRTFKDLTLFQKDIIREVRGHNNATFQHITHHLEIIIPTFVFICCVFVARYLSGTFFERIGLKHRIARYFNLNTHNVIGTIAYYTFSFGLTELTSVLVMYILKVLISYHWYTFIGVSDNHIISHIFGRPNSNFLYLTSISTIVMPQHSSV